MQFLEISPTCAHNSQLTVNSIISRFISEHFSEIIDKLNFNIMQLWFQKNGLLTKFSKVRFDIFNVNTYTQYIMVSTSWSSINPAKYILQWSCRVHRVRYGFRDPETKNLIFRTGWKNGLIITFFVYPIFNILFFQDINKNWRR